MKDDDGFKQNQVWRHVRFPWQCEAASNCLSCRWTFNALERYRPWRLWACVLSRVVRMWHVASLKIELEKVESTVVR